MSILTQQVCGAAWECAFLTSSQSTCRVAWLWGTQADLVRSGPALVLLEQRDAFLLITSRNPINAQSPRAVTPLSFHLHHLLQGRTGWGSGLQPCSHLVVVLKAAQSCLMLCDHVDFTVHGILQARILEWVAVPFSRGSYQLRDRTQVSHTAGGFFTSWATREPLAPRSPLPIKHF